MFKVIMSNILNRSNSAADRSIAFKFGTKFHHVTGDTLQMFKVKVQSQGHKVRGQGHSVKYCISSKKAIIRQWIVSATSNLAWRRN